MDGARLNAYVEREENMASIRKYRGLTQFRSVVLGVALATLSGAALAADQVPIKLVINQSPWLEPFITLVDAYEAETGNKVELDVTPFSGLLEKIRNSVRSNEGTYDLVNINSVWLAEIYSGGFLAPLDDLQPGYALQAGVADFGNTTYWDAEKATFSEDGDLMGVPLNGNVQVLFYNADAYEKLGLSEPETWPDLIANAKAIQDDGTYYGFVPRSGRSSIVYNFTPYLFSQGGAFFEVTGPKQVNVTINSEAGLAALKTYLELATEAGPPNPGAIEQAELIQLLATGRGAQAIAVVAAWGNFEDPNKSAVVGKINAAALPAGPDGMRASAAGHWVAGIPRNVPTERQQAALAFLDWFQGKDVQIAYVEAGGVPVRDDLDQTGLADDARFRFISAYSSNAKNAVLGLPLPEAAEISQTIELPLNRAVIGDLTPEAALNESAEAIADILTRAGYDVSMGIAL